MATVTKPLMNADRILTTSKGDQIRICDEYYLYFQQQTVKLKVFARVFIEHAHFNVTEQAHFNVT